MSEPHNRRRRRASPKNTEWRGGVLHGRIRIKGKLRRWSLRTGDVEIARARVTEDIARLKAAVFYGDHRVRYEDIAAAWAERHISHEVGPNTAKRYAVSLTQLAPFLNELYLDEIDKAKIEEVVIARRAAGVSTATIRRDLTALSSVLIFADVADNHALARLKRLKERRNPIVLPDAEHIGKIIERAPGRLPALVAAAWRTGCRLEELATAERTRLDHARRQLTVVGKGNKLRVIDLEFGGAYELLRALPARLGCKWLFWHHQGTPYRNLSSRFAALARSEFAAAYDATHRTNAKTRPPIEQLLAAQDAPGWTDIGFRPFRFHDLRHRHAVDWLKAGRSIYDLQQRLGHASIKTTEIYLAFLTPDEARTVKYGAANDTAGQRGA